MYLDRFSNGEKWEACSVRQYRFGWNLRAPVHIHNCTHRSGVKGFEPLHVGTKNRCLTTWLYSIRLPEGGKEKQGSKNERIGELLDRTGRVLGNYLTVIPPPTTIYSDRILLTDLR